MGLPLYLAMTSAEMRCTSQFPAHFAYMACHFSPYGEGISNIPDALPDQAMLILNDRMPCHGHSPSLIVQQLSDAVSRLGCESILLDFIHPPDSESEAMVHAIVEAHTCPVAVSAQYADRLRCPVFLPPCPLHVPLEEYLLPWKGREIWLEAALCQEEAAVTENGTDFTSQFPPERLEDGFYDEILRCYYRIRTDANRVSFTLFDTAASLEKKMELAAELGVKRAVGLWQEFNKE